MLWGRRQEGEGEGTDKGCRGKETSGQISRARKDKDRDKLLPRSLAQGLRLTYQAPKPSPGLGLLVLPCCAEAQGRKGIGPGSPKRVTSPPPRVPQDSLQDQEVLLILRMAWGGAEELPRFLFLWGSLLWPAHLSDHSLEGSPRLCLQEGQESDSQKPPFVPFGPALFKVPTGSLFSPHC